jgi:integrase
MQRKQLTDDLIAALAAKRKRYVVYDNTIRSLGVRVSPKGKKTFIVVGRFNGNKHPTRRKLGVVGRLTIEQARERALKFDAKPSDKFGAVAEHYFKHIAKQRRAWEVERTIRRELMPQWENKQLATITRQDVIDAVKAIHARGTPYAAHHLLAYVKGFFNYAIANNLVDHSPADRIKPKVLIGKREPRQRVLNDDELRALWQAAECAGPFGKIAQLILATGTRRGEAAFARREEFDDKLWTICASHMITYQRHWPVVIGQTLHLATKLLIFGASSRILAP